MFRALHKHRVCTRPTYSSWSRGILAARIWWVGFMFLADVSEINLFLCRFDRLNLEMQGFLLHTYSVSPRIGQCGSLLIAPLLRRTVGEDVGPTEVCHPALRLFETSPSSGVLFMMSDVAQVDDPSLRASDHADVSRLFFH